MRSLRVAALVVSAAPAPCLNGQGRGWRSPAERETALALAVTTLLAVRLAVVASHAIQRM